MPLQRIFVAVPALNRKAEAWSADLNVWPTANTLSGQDREDARAVGDELPTAVRLLADEAVAGSGISVAVGTAFGNDSLLVAIAIDVPHLFNSARCVGGRWVVTSLPLLTLEFEAGGLERSGLVSG